MKLAVYSTKQYDKKYLQQVNESFGFELEFFDFLLTEKTAKTANGCEAVCIFVNDDGSRPVLEELKKHGVKYIALRCAGFNNVDLDAAKELGLKVVRVPAYDPEAVAEHAIGMMMTLNRRIHRAYQRTRDANFSLEGLTGFTMYGKTAGVIGTGKIGVAMLRILKGFGMRLLAFDPYPSAAALELGVEYVDLPTLFSESDVISLHCPLTPENYHLLNEAAFDQMKNGVMIVNTSRGALIDSQAAIEALKNQKIGSLGMDVYENELVCLPQRVVYRAPGIPDSRSSDQYFSDYAAKLKQSGKRRNLPERTGLILPLPCIPGELIQIIPKDLSSSILKIVLNQKQ